MRKKLGLMLGTIVASAMIGLCGCGSTDDIIALDNGGSMEVEEPAEDSGIEGADWRTWGWISEYLTIRSEKGDPGRDVLACFMGSEGDYSSVDLYEDDETQSLIQSIELPVKNLQELKIEVTDLMEDEIDDLAISGKDTEGNEYTWFYLQTEGEDEIFVPYEEGEEGDLAEATEEEEEGKEESEEGPGLVNTEFDMSLKDEKDDYLYYECYGNSYLCDEESEELYPELSRALMDIDEMVKGNYERNIESFDEEAHDFVREMIEQGQGEYTFYTYSETSLEYCSDKVVSLLRTEYGFLGGAHPDYWFESVNLKPETGEYILLSDVITDKEELDRILKEKLNEKYPDGDFFDLDEALLAYDPQAEPFEQEMGAYTFTLDPSGVTFFFGPYDLNAYAYGSQDIKLSYDELSEILKDGFYEEYFEAAKG